MSRRIPADALTEAELRPGDLILSTSSGWESWLIRWLDGGAYSQAGLYDGERVILAGAYGIERRPLHTCDVFRFQSQGRPLGEGGLDARVLLERARAYLDHADAYRCTPLYLVGLLLIMRRFARPPWRRNLVEALGGVLLVAIRRSIDRHFPTGVIAVTGSELVTRIFSEARRVSGGPYDIRLELERRHERHAWPPTSGRFEHLMQETEEIIARVNPELSIAVSQARAAAPGSIGSTVVAGGPLAPACFVSPGDLQHSPSFVYAGRLVVRPPNGRFKARSSVAAPSGDGEPLPPSGTP
jgi:hypothetical protein